MSTRPIPPQLEEIFAFRPKWWWDPIPPWLVDRLELVQISELAITQLELQKTVLTGQLKALDQAIAVVKKMGR